jgi:hypothetical protein
MSRKGGGFLVAPDERTHKRLGRLTSLPGPAGGNGPWLWDMSEMPSNNILWINVKLTTVNVQRKRGRKRTYHLGWSADENRFARSRELATLLAAHPDLYAKVEARMKELYKDWLAYDVAEQDIEEARALGRANAERRRAAKAAKVEEVDPFS